MNSAVKILIVDDIEANLISLEYLLYDYFDDIFILKANSGEEALKISLQEEIDFMILDIQMPEIDGFEVAKLLQINNKTKNIPIIFLTAAFKEEEFQKRGFEIGAVDYLTKPINNHHLVNKLKLYIEVFKKNKQLKDINHRLNQLLKENKKQKDILQSILNSEQNLVLVIDFETIFILNQSFLEFFQIQNYQEFKIKYNSIIDLFIDNNIHSLNTSKIPKNITEQEKFKELLKLTDLSNESDKIVCIKDINGEKKSFFINLSKENDFYLLTLTDITKMQQHHIETTQKAFYDNLTGIYNRNKLNEFLNQEIKRASRTNEIFSTMIFDIDNFKQINDTYGHLKGDEVLKTISKKINDRIRETDFFCRWGGEEFILILTQTTLHNAKIIAQNIKNMVENIQHKDIYKKITISIGLTQYQNGDTMENILQRCDTALYEAKAKGKNCVVEFIEKKGV